MPNPIASTTDPALLPAAAAARPTQAGMEAMARVLDGETLEGRKAVKRPARASASSRNEPASADGRGQLVNRRA